MFLSDKLRVLLSEARKVGNNTNVEIPSSVLVPILKNAQSKTEEIVLTKRTSEVETHKSQVSFPGGYREAADADLLVTALRESQEEIGTLHTDIEVLGPLPTVSTRGDLKIQPWVGILNAPYGFSPNRREVESILYLPMARFVEEGLKMVEVRIEGYQVKSLGIEVEGELVWGATARILKDLHDLLVSQR